MVYVLVNSRTLRRGPNGAMTRDNAYLQPVSERQPVVYPAESEIPFRPGPRPGIARKSVAHPPLHQPTPPQPYVARRSNAAARASNPSSDAPLAPGDVTDDVHSGRSSPSASSLPRMLIESADAQDDINGSVGSPQSGSVAGDDANGVSPSSSALLGDSPRPRYARSPMNRPAESIGDKLQVSSFLATSSIGEGVMTRHGTSIASPLTPVLVHGIDVQACLSHVGMQKKCYYEDCVAELQTELLATIPPAMKPEIDRKFPGALKKCVGVLGAMAAVSRMSQQDKKVNPMPSEGARRVVGLHDEAKEARKMLRTASGRARDPRDRLEISMHTVLDFDAGRPSSRSQDFELLQSPKRIAEHYGGRRNTFLYQTYEQAAEELMEMPDTPMFALHDEDDKLQAIRQQQLQKRMEFLKHRERAARAGLRAEEASAFYAFFDLFVWDTRYALMRSETSGFQSAIRAAENSAALRLALHARVNRRSYAAEAVQKVISDQEKQLRAETAARIGAIDALGSEAVRTVQRANLYTEQNVKAAITQERDARLRDLLVYRRSNPTSYFPAYDDVADDTEFVPMRIALNDERERQMLQLDRESAAYVQEGETGGSRPRQITAA
jgi:hypothetical protein